jgi:hypothetical protein
MRFDVLLEEVHDGSVHLHAGVGLDRDAAIDDGHRMADPAAHVQDVDVAQVRDACEARRQIDQRFTGMLVACGNHARRVPVEVRGNLQSRQHLFLRQKPQQVKCMHCIQISSGGAGSQQPGIG